MCMYTHVPPSDESLTHYAALLRVEDSQLSSTSPPILSPCSLNIPHPCAMVKTSFQPIMSVGRRKSTVELLGT
jgi:hypothetical protein